VEVNSGDKLVETWTAEEIEEGKIHPVVKAARRCASFPAFPPPFPTVVAGQVCMQINNNPLFDHLMLSCIIINSIFMALPYHGMSTQYEEVAPAPPLRRGKSWFNVPIWQGPGVRRADLHGHLRGGVCHQDPRPRGGVPPDCPPHPR
jgi:hypothetical protein